MAHAPPPVRSRALLVSLATLAAMAAATPVIVQAARAVLAVDATTPLDWVPPDHPQRRDYDRFTRAFAGGDVAVLSWPGCELDSPGIDRILAAATGDRAPRTGDGRPFFDAVDCGTSAVRDLVESPLRLDRVEAVERLTGMLVGSDGRATCLAFSMAPASMADRRRAIEWIRAAATDLAGVAPDDVRLAGSANDTVVIDDASFGSLLGLAPVAALATLGLAWLSLGSLRFSLLVFAVSGWCVGLSFATLAAAGERMSPVLIVMPVLVLVLGVSAGVHVYNYLQEAAGGGAADVAARGARLAWWPCALSAGTTAIGLGSLVVSDLEPIRAFGVHGAIAVMATPIAMLLVLPGLFEAWPPRPRPAGRWDAAGRGVCEFVIRHPAATAVTFAIVTAVAAAGLPSVRTSVRIDTLFRPESRVIRDYAWLEERIGPLVPIEVVLRFAPESDLRPAARLRLVRSVEERLAGMAGVTAASSAAGFLPDLQQRGAVVAALGQAAGARRLAAGGLGYVRDVEGEQWWRVTARVPALADVDYGEFLGRVRAAVEPVVAEAGGADRGVAVSCTGVMPLVHELQNALLRDLFVSFVSACGLITITMMLVEGGVLRGLVAMASNVFPSVLLFGILGWRRVPLDIGSVMTASIALGMAIDGTLHFLAFYRRSRGAGADPPTAVRDAYDTCAAALVQGSVVCGLGMLVFAASSFAPTARFSWMMALLLLAALAGDLLLLPALLLGPAAGWFSRGRVAAPTPRPASDL